MRELYQTLRYNSPLRAFRFHLTASRKRKSAIIPTRSTYYPIASHSMASAVVAIADPAEDLESPEVSPPSAIEATTRSPTDFIPFSGLDLVDEAEELSRSAKQTSDASAVSLPKALPAPEPQLALPAPKKKQVRKQASKILYEELRPTYYPEYYFEDGLRRVVPYNYTYNTFCKERWRGKTLIDIFLSEFRDRPEEYYVSCPEHSILPLLPPPLLFTL